MVVVEKKSAGRAEGSESGERASWASKISSMSDVSFSRGAKVVREGQIEIEMRWKHTSFIAITCTAGGAFDSVIEVGADWTVCAIVLFSAVPT